MIKAVAYFKRATGLDPSDAQTWDDYARAAMDAGRTGEAKAAFAHAVQGLGKPMTRGGVYWAMLGLGDIALAQGSLPDALRHYQAAAAVAEPIAAADPGNAGWQRDLALGHGASPWCAHARVTIARRLCCSSKAALSSHASSRCRPTTQPCRGTSPWFETQLAALKNVSPN